MADGRNPNSATGGIRPAAARHAATAPWRPLRQAIDLAQGRGRPALSILAAARNAQVSEDASIMTAAPISYFSDVLCIWAYVAQARVDATRQAFPELRLDHRFVSVFGDARTKLRTAWHGRGEFEGYGAHVLKVAERFPHVEISRRVWHDVQPASSASPHLFLLAVRNWEREQPGSVAGVVPLFERVMWEMRVGFFRDDLDIAKRDVQRSIAAPLGVDVAAVERLIDNGTAFASLQADYQEAEKMRIEGSPTFVLNEGRQKLYGNVGFRIIEANIKELLREPAGEQASWC
jgi:predicted DsbA family dithiol-disulfide isomerase